MFTWSSPELPLDTAPSMAAPLSIEHLLADVVISAHSTLNREARYTLRVPYESTDGRAAKGDAELRISAEYNGNGHIRHNFTFEFGGAPLGVYEELVAKLPYSERKLHFLPAVHHRNGRKPGE